MVQNRSDYVRDGLDHLQDPVTYRELSGDPTNSLCNNITPDLYNDGLLNKESINLTFVLHQRMLDLLASTS